MGKRDIELAVLQTRVDELAKRASDGLNENPDFQRRLSGIAHEAKNLEDITRKAQKAMRSRDTHDANRYTGEFALTAKNLADNLNLLLQNIYGASKIHLNNLEQNTQNAPKASDGRTLCDIFTEMHDPNKDNPIISARHKKGHGDGHQILAKGKTKSGYRMHSASSTEDPIDWLQNESMNYLFNTAEILDIIANKDLINFKEEKYPRKREEVMNLFLRGVERYKRTAITIAASTILAAGIVGGIGGTLAYQEMEKSKNIQKDNRKMNFLLERELEIVHQVDNWEYPTILEYEDEFCKKTAEKFINSGMAGYLNKNRACIKKILDEKKIDPKKGQYEPEGYIRK